MKVRSRLLRAGVSAVTVGGFVLAGIGLTATPSFAAGGETAAQSLGTTAPAAPTAANPIVPGGGAAINSIEEVLTVKGDATANFGAVAFSIPVPATSTVPGNVVLAGWTVNPTCTTGPVGGGGTVSCAGGVLNTTGTATAKVTYTLDAGYPQPSVAFTPKFSNVTGFDTGPVTVNPTGNGNVAANKIVSEALQTLTMTPPTQNVIQGGNSYSQVITFGNSGPSFILGHTFLITAPSIGGVALQNTNALGGLTGCVPGAGAPFPNTFTCGPYPMVGLGTTPFTFTWAVPATGTPAANPLTTTIAETAQTTAGVGTPQPIAPTLPTASAVALIIQPLSIAKSGPATVTPGSTSPNLQYTITAGTTTALTLAQITDPIPTGSVFVGFTPGGGNVNPINCAVVGTTVQCSTAAGGVAAPFGIAAADSVSLQFQVPAATTASPITNTASFVSTGAGQVDTLASNTVSTTVTPLATETVIKVQTSPSPAATPPANEVNVGSNATYTITVTNAGPSNAAAPTLTDTVSAAGVSIVSIVPAVANPDTWTCGAASCTIATLPVGTTDSFTVTVKVNSATGLTAGTPVSFTNTATLTTTTPTTSTALQTSTVTTLVNLGADLKATLTVPTHFSNVPGSLPVTFGVTNLGPLTALNPVATITLPAGTSFASLGAIPAGSTCTTPKPGSSGTITCTLNANLASGASASYVIQVFYPVQTAISPAPVTLSDTVSFGAGTPSATVANFDPTPGNNTVTGTTTAGTPAPGVNPGGTTPPAPGKGGGGF